MSASGAAAKSLVVLTVDDHPLMRSALREVMGLAAERVELLEAADPPEGLALLERRPDTDLVLLDLNFAAHDGLEFIERFRAAAPATPLLVYTMHEDAATLRQALARGAVGIVPKTHSAKLLQKAIDLVMDGGIYLPAELARQLALPEAAQAPSPGPSMTEQQWRILELIAQGLPNKAIARDLGIAASTVKNQLTVVFDKLGVSNRTQAAIAARALIKSKPPGHQAGP
jgi:DNA-binding NarL/FixJ family response regulator